MFTCSHGEKCRGKCIDCALLVLRIAAGIIFLIHGWGKLFGSGPAAVGIAGFTGMLTQIGVPAPGFFAWVVGLTESLGGLALILGIGTQVAAVLLAVVMAVAFLTVKKGLPMGDPDLALFAINVALALVGGGMYSLMPGHCASPETPKEQPMKTM